MFRLIILITLLSACTAQNNSLKSFRQLAGTWVDSNESGKFTESWKWVNDTLIKGTSCMTEGKDTLFTENLQLVAQNGGIYYIPTVSNQNDGKSIRFKLVSRENNVWVFENKKHDFPTRIVYTFKGTDSLMASVEGKENKKFQKYTFHLKKK